jgi:hypothetical protein
MRRSGSPVSVLGIVPLIPAPSIMEHREQLEHDRIGAGLIG